MKLKKLISSLCTSITLMCIFFSDVVLARAGGGGGGGGGSSFYRSSSGYSSSDDDAAFFCIVIGGLGVLLICSWVYAWRMSRTVKQKNEECRTLISKISMLDTCWELDAMKARVEDVYFNVQDAWTQRDQHIAKSHVSKKLFDNHHRQLREMKAKDRRNVLENVQLLNSKIVQIRDSEDDAKDQFWALIEGSMIDYTINTVSGDLTSGEKKQKSFTELWLFVRDEQTWVLDEIVPHVAIGKLSLFTAQSDTQGDTLISNG